VNSSAIGKAGRPDSSDSGRAILDDSRLSKTPLNPALSRREVPKGWRLS